MRSGPSVSSGIFCSWLVPAGRITSRIEKISPVHWPMSMSSAGGNTRKTTDARTPDNVVLFRVNLPRQIDLIGGAHLRAEHDRDHNRRRGPQAYCRVLPL